MKNLPSIPRPIWQPLHACCNPLRPALFNNRFTSNSWNPFCFPSQTRISFLELFVHYLDVFGVKSFDSSSVFSSELCFHTSWASIFMVPKKALWFLAWSKYFLFFLFNNFSKIIHTWVLSLEWYITICEVCMIPELHPKFALTIQD